MSTAFELLPRTEKYQDMKEDPSGEDSRRGSRERIPLSVIVIIGCLFRGDANGFFQATQAA
jgi:hypothetical protein